MKHALIIGSGPAGTVAAMALQRAGWEPAIFEAFEHSAGLQQGVFLTVAVNGLDALASIEADQAVRSIGFPTGNIRFSTGVGRDLGSMPIGPVLADGTSTRTVRRAELYAALYDEAVRRGIPIEHGRKLVALEESDDGVTALFADGTTARGDLLVGADGIESRTRTLVDHRARAPRSSGLANCGGFARVPGIAADGGDYRMVWGKRCFFGYTVAPDDEVWWFANPPSRERIDSASDVIDLLAEDRTPAADIVRATGGDLYIGDQLELPAVRTWRRGSAVLVGDAAHAVSPATGQGVSLAWEDAAVLGLLLREMPVAQALPAYDAARRKRVERVAAWGRRMGNTKTAGPVGRHIRDLILPRILAAGSTPKAMSKQAWLFDHHVDAPRTS